MTDVHSKTCGSCGAEVPDDAKSCHACGSAVYRQEDKSQPPEPAPAEYQVPEASADPTSEVAPVACPTPEQFGTTEQRVRKSRIVFAAIMSSGCLAGAIAGWLVLSFFGAFSGFIVGLFVSFYLIFEPFVANSFEVENKYRAAREEYKKVVEAKMKFEQTIALDSSNADAHYWLALTHLTLGDTAAARAALETHIGLAPNGQYAEQARAMILELRSPTMAAAGEEYKRELQEHPERIKVGVGPGVPPEEEKTQGRWALTEDWGPQLLKAYLGVSAALLLFHIAARSWDEGRLAIGFYKASDSFSEDFFTYIAATFAITFALLFGLGGFMSFITRRD